MSPRTAQANQIVRDERQAKILTAAMKVFARQGYTATKISDIAAQAGVSYGLVDHYYGKKEDIYTAVVRRALEGAWQLQENSLGLSGSPWERLHYLCAEMLSGLQRVPEYVLLVNQVSSIAAIPEETKQLLYHYEQRIQAAQVDLIRQGQAAGQVVGGDAQTLMILFSAVIQGLAVQWFDPLLREELSKHFPDVETVLRIFKP